MRRPVEPPRLAGRRIVFVFPGEVLGGAEVNALELAVQLRRKGAEVAICALDDVPGRGRSAADAAGIPWSVARVPWVGGRREKGQSLLRLASALRRLRPNALVPLTNLPNVACGLTWRLAGASTCIWNQQDVLGTKRIAQGLFRRALSRSPVVVTAADHVRRWLLETFDPDPRRVHAVYGQVVLPAPLRSRASWREELALGPDHLGACMLGHFHEGKDHVTLLRAWRSVVDRLEHDGRRAVLFLPGRSAGTADSVKAAAFDLDLRGHVRFPGDVDDVPGLLGAVDLGVFSSRSEGMPRGVTEAMYAGLAVAATDAPGVREAVGAPGEPFLAPPGDAPGLAASILALAEPELCARVGRENACLIRERQSPERTTEVYAALLASALARGAEVEAVASPAPSPEPG